MFVCLCVILCVYLFVCVCAWVCEWGCLNMGAFEYNMKARVCV